LSKTAQHTYLGVQYFVPNARAELERKIFCTQFRGWWCEFEFDATVDSTVPIHIIELLFSISYSSDLNIAAKRNIPLSRECNDVVSERPGLEPRFAIVAGRVG
jgi:hypothetical protein